MQRYTIKVANEKIRTSIFMSRTFLEKLGSLQRSGWILSLKKLWKLRSLYRSCTGVVPELYRSCTGIVPELWWSCAEVVPELFRICTGIVPELYRSCDGVAPELHRNCTGVVPELYRSCTGVVPELYRSCTGTVPELYRNCTGVAVELWWSCTGVVMELYRSCIGVVAELYRSCGGVVPELWWSYTEVYRSYTGVIPELYSWKIHTWRQELSAVCCSIVGLIRWFFRNRDGSHETFISLESSRARMISSVWVSLYMLQCTHIHTVYYQIDFPFSRLILSVIDILIQRNTWYKNGFLIKLFE